MVEFDSSVMRYYCRILENSQLSSLVKETGSAEAKYLRMLSEDDKSNSQENVETLGGNDEIFEEDGENNPLLRPIPTVT